MTSKDLINRQQAIDELRTCQTYLFDTRDKDMKISLEDAEYCIERLPSAQPERKRGRCVWCSSPFRIEYYWIDREGNTASFQDEECHVVATGIANFCPNCGADMRQKEGNDG